MSRLFVVSHLYFILISYAPCKFGKKSVFNTDKFYFQNLCSLCEAFMCNLKDVGHFKSTAYNSFLIVAFELAENSG